MKKVVLFGVSLLTFWSELQSQSVIPEPNSFLNFHANPLFQTHIPSDKGLKKSISAETEDSQRILYPDTKWSVLKTNIYGWYPDEIINYKVDGDTIINSNSYCKVFRNNILYACLREVNMKLFAHFPSLENQNEKLLYDFTSWTSGDSYQYNMIEENDEMYSMDIMHLGNILLDDGKDYPMANNHIIQSIGSLSGVFEFLQYWPSDGSNWKLRTYYRNGIQLYDMNKNYLSSDKIKEEALLVYIDANGLLVFTNKSNDIAGIEEILIYSVNGQLVKMTYPGTGNLFVVHGLQKGIYIYQVKYTDINKTDCGKIIIR